MQNGKLYNIKTIEKAPSEHQNRLCVEKLENILIRHFGNENKLESDQIEYLPAVFFDHRRYQAGSDKNAIFLVKHPDINKIMKFANCQKMMPPKSTWLEPKPCLHMVIRLPF